MDRRPRLLPLGATEGVGLRIDEVAEVGENDWLAEQFEDQRRHLRSVAYRMLRSPSDADDGVRTLSSWCERAEKGDVIGANQAARTSFPVASTYAR
jgi:hypothetical protein